MGRRILCNWVHKVIHSFTVIKPHNMWKKCYCLPCANFSYIYRLIMQLIVHCHQNWAHCDTETLLLINILTNNSFCFCSFISTTKEHQVVDLKDSCHTYMYVRPMSYIEDTRSCMQRKIHPNFFWCGTWYPLLHRQLVTPSVPSNFLSILFHKYFITCIWCSKRLKLPTPRNQTGGEQISTVVPDSWATKNYNGHFLTCCCSSINIRLLIMVKQIHIDYI